MISYTNYKLIAEWIAEMKTDVEAAQAELAKIRQVLAVADAPAGKEGEQARISLMVETVANELGRKYVDKTPVELKSLVVALQRYILTFVPTVTTFLQMGGLTVSRAFADLSEEAGYVIADAYIDD